MGIGYAASPLHRIESLVVDETDPGSTEPPPGLGLPPFPGAIYHTGPLGFRSPAVKDIVAWRERLSATYAGQLGERLDWDEASDFYQGEDAAVSCHVAFQYVAAMLEEGGMAALARLVGRPKTAHAEVDRALDAAARRGFTGRFPQLLLGSQRWLPFQRNLIIEAADWEGRTDRFGSAFRLYDEVRELRAAIATADARAVAWTGAREDPEMLLWSAYRAGDSLARICAAATARHLPFWMVG